MPPDSAKSADTTYWPPATRSYSPTRRSAERTETVTRVMSRKATSWTLTERRIIPASV